MQPQFHIYQNARLGVKYLFGQPAPFVGRLAAIRATIHEMVESGDMSLSAAREANAYAEAWNAAVQS